MTQPDIVFIVLDTQRADRLGCYGYQQAVTPNLDRFAKDSALFLQGISPAQWTIPSHASMFTGLYPTAHQVTQSNHSLSDDWPHVAESLAAKGYETVAFCNNPLVGVLDNGFRRGFERFYNYGGAVPTVPPSGKKQSGFRRLLSHLAKPIRRISYPIQNFFSQSDLAFRISLSPLFTPIWSRVANFKGQNERSVADVSHFLGSRKETEPLFLFMNLMETHMPFQPPARFIDQIAPWLRESKAARSVMRRWNRDAYRWAAPLSKPLTDTESRVLNALYDAEVAYQDDYMGELLDILAARPNTLTIIVGDHGDAIGDHGFMGHTFAAYQELVHVPLIVHWPEQISAASASECVASGEVVVPFAVSTRRVYHTMLAAAGFSQPLPGQPAPTELSLLRSIEGDDPEDGTAYAEVYAPLNFAEAVARREPELLERLRCYATRRAVVNKGWKLIQVDGVADELFDLAVDPEEKRDKLVEMKDSAETDHLNTSLATFAQQMNEHRATIQAGDEIDTDSDEMQRQMRALGYIE